MQANTTGDENTAMGDVALLKNTTGSYNAAVGSHALYFNTTGTNNSALGTRAGYSNSSGSNNTFIGYKAGEATQGSGNICIGNEAGGSFSGSDKLYIDNSNTSASLIYGDFSNRYLRINGELQAYGNISTNGNWISTNGSDNGINMTADGYVSINTTTNTAPLTVNGDAQVGGGSSDYDGDSEYLGISGQSDIWYMAVQNESSVGASDFFIGKGFAEDAIFHIQNDGNVGIGTSTPTKGKLEVSGTGSTVSLTDYGFWSFNGSGIEISSGTSEFSIYADGRIAGYVLYAHSDGRIKDIIGVSDATNDLQILNKIRITDYTYKDKAARGNSVQKKVIAQELKQVYPQAVDSTLSEVVPDIYRMATIRDGWVDLKTDLKEGESVQLIFKNGKRITKVLETAEGRFRVDAQEEGEIFVFGRQVDDFHTVDYEAISMLNVSATQELAKRLEAVEKENRDLKTENRELKTRLKEETEALKSQLDNEKTANSERFLLIEQQLGIGTTVLK